MGLLTQQGFVRIVIVEAEKPRRVREKLEYFEVAAKPIVLEEARLVDENIKMG